MNPVKRGERGGEAARPRVASDRYQIVVVGSALTRRALLVLERRRVREHPHAAVRVQCEPASQLTRQAASLALHHDRLRLAGRPRSTVDDRARVVAHALR